MHINQSFEQKLQIKLDERANIGLLRSLITSEDKIDFSSNDYLGFAKSIELKKISEEAGIVGATGSRLISGNSKEAELAETMVADFHQTEAALIFNNGYVANVGLLSSIAGKGDTFLSDEYIHASMIDGIRLSGANKYRFKHNDVADLERGLKLASGNKFVAVESLYSMDGDEAPLKEIAGLCEQYNALLIVDEAHANGIFGENGKGLVHQYQLQDKVFACVYTFGKAIGLHGAAVTGSNTLKNYLINFARPFIYSTALPPYAYQQISKAYQMLADGKQENLFELIRYFKKSIKDAEIQYPFLDSNSQIQGIIIGDNTKAKALSTHLFEKGMYVKAILSPTVPLGAERLRICLHTFNTKSEIDLLITEIQKKI